METTITIIDYHIITDRNKEKKLKKRMPFDFKSNKEKAVIK